jgi:hypothetical protein
MGGRTRFVCLLTAVGALVLGGGLSVGETPSVEDALRWGAATHLTGPPPGHTGGFGEPTCVVCHEGNDVNAFGGSVTLDGLPAKYLPGEGYVLTIVLTAEETQAAGFQLAARFSQGAESGRPAGLLAPLDSRVATTLGESGQPYAHHTRSGTDVSTNGGSSWSVQWHAPSQGGPVVFHYAANSGNDDDSPLGDLVFVGAQTVGPSDPP